MYSYERYEYDDMQRIRTCVYIYIYIYIYICMNLISMKMVKWFENNYNIACLLTIFENSYKWFCFYVFSSLSYKHSISV